MSRVRRTAFVAAAALLLQGLAGVAPSAAQVLPAPVLYVSGSADRSDPRPLDGTTVTGSVAVFVSQPPGSLTYRRVTFSIDGVAVHTDDAVPWDLLGTDGCADGIPCPLGTATMWDAVPLRQGTHSVTAHVETHGNLAAAATVTAQFTVVHPASEPPRVYPEPVPGGVPTTTIEAAKFLYTGEFPPQSGVAEGAIDESLVAVVRGEVTRRDGTPLPNVAVSVAGHPEYGTTRTRADGWYDMVVNAGVPLTVTLAADGYVTAERVADPAAQAWAVVDDAVLVPFDGTATVVQPASIPAGTFAVARGPAVTDGDGSRRSTLLVPAGTTAELVLPDGTRQPAPTWTVRQTELTVGESGADAMPAPLPPTSAYTYAIDLSLDEARAAGATRTEFSQPLWHYTENFLGFPAGTAVPAGYYDPALHVWVPSDNGVVLAVVSETAGRADLDVTGDGVADDVTAIGLTDAERAQVADLYGPGDSLWRTPVSHFSLWDLNWGFGLPLDAIWPFLRGLGGALAGLLPNCTAVGSVIGCESQSLGERVSLTGIGADLVYDTRRVPGYRGDSALSLLVTPPTVPPSLKRVEALIDVGGRRFTRTLAAGPDARLLFDWDGVDAFGRRLNGTQVATLRIRYVYDGAYTATERFMAPGDETAPLTGDRTRRELYLDRSFTAELRPSVVADPRGLGLGGWTLTGHQTFDALSGMLAMGDGRFVSVSAAGPMVRSIAGTGSAEFGGDGGPATEASLSYPGGVAFDGAGNYYVSDTFNDRIRKVTPDGVITTLAGTGTFGFGGDGGPATAAAFASPLELAVAPDGALYVADVDNHRVRRIGADGVVTTVAGSGVRGYGGDGGSAVAAQLAEPVSVAVGPDGRLVVADYANHRVRVVTPGGAISTVAGTGVAGNSGDGGRAVLAQLRNPSSVAVDAAGAVYVADAGNGRIRRITPDGLISTVAASLDRPVGVALDRQGFVYVAEQRAHRVRRIAPDGVVSTVIGTGVAGFSGDDGFAAQAKVSRPRGVAVAPDGSLVVVDAGNQRLRRVLPARALSSVTSRLVPSPDDDGTVFEFDHAGRHTRTLDDLTGLALLTFGYDPAGRLRSVVDRDGNAVTITRPTASSVAVTSPDGHATTLTLDAAGWATSIVGPGSLSNAAGYSSGGLLETFTDRNNRSSLYGYDSLGRLESARGRDLKTTTLTRTELADGSSVAVETPGGHTTTYRLTRASDGVLTREVFDPSGIVQRDVRRPDGSSTVTLGTTVLVQESGADPRWGTLRPVPARTTVTAPGRQPVTTTVSRSVALASADLLDVATLVDTHRTGSRVWRRSYAKATRTLTAESPEGRTTVTVLDGSGRVVSQQVGDLAPVSYSYDERGRLSGTARLDRTSTVTYQPNGFVDTTENALGQVTSYSYDARFRPSAVSGPGGVLATSYDGNGNVTTITPPGRTAYTLAPAVDDRLDSYTVPDADAQPDTVDLHLDDDRRFTGATLPSGTEVSFGYDTAGHLASITYGAASTTFTWTGGRLSAATSGGVVVTPGFTSSLPTSHTWSGPVSGSVSWAFDDELRVGSQTVGGTPAVAFGYDGDGLLVSAGAESLTRSPSTGAVTGTSLGSVTTTTSYTSFGEPASFGASYGAAPLYAVSYGTRDDAGRIGSRTETTDGATATTGYGYDATNRLDTVTVDGVEVASYGYDAAGNLVTETAGGGTVTSTYDAQDRITTRDGVAYSYDADGQRVAAVDGAATTTYGWSHGRLASVALPGGPTVSYVYDAFGHRVARLVGGVVTAGYLWHGSQLVAVTDAAGTVVSRFVYGSRAHVPDYLVTGGATYRLISDERGSVRLVVDTATGVVAQRLAYDPWGRVATDTNPGFQPFGFAGGLTDPDTGLVRFGARDYDPVTTQWLSRDTIGFSGGTNHYAYADGDPVNRIDPTGHNAVSCLADVLGLLGMIPVVGTIFDIASALLYLSQGQWGDAVLALAGIVLPFSAQSMKGLARFGGPALQGVVAGRIAGYTKHGLAQAISRDAHGVAPSAIVDAVRRPVREVIDEAQGTTKYVGKAATVVLNDGGKVITTWARNRIGWRY